MENTLNEKESLRIINEMIAQAKNNFQKGAGDSGIFCGCFVTLIALLNFGLIYWLDNPNTSFHIWWLMIPMMFISKYLKKRNEKESFVKTHIDKIVGAVWTAFPISIAVLLLLIFGLCFVFKTSYFSAMITPGILILMGMAQYVTGRAIRLKLYIYGSVVFWIGALVCVGVYACGNIPAQFLVLAVCCLFGLVVPSYQLNKLAK